MENLNKLEQALLKSISEVYENEFPFIKEHIPFLRVSGRNNTGAGMYVYFTYTKDGEGLIKDNVSDLLGTGQIIEIEQLELGLGFALDIENGKIILLELITYGDEVWDGKFENFKLGDFDGN